MNQWMETMLNRMAELMGGYVPNLVGALGILVVGWLLALVVRALVTGALKRTTIDDRLASWLTGGRPVAVEGAVGTMAFWLVMLFVAIGVFQALDLTPVTQPLNALLNELGTFAPRLGGAAVLLLLAWAIATILRNVLRGALRAMKLDERLGEGAGGLAVSASVSEAVYWLVLLLFLPAVLGALALEGLLLPVQSLTDELLGFLPNLFGAGLILAVGWFVAMLVRRIVASFLAAVGADRLGERVGLQQALGTVTLSALTGLVVYVLVLIPVFIAALNSLDLQAVTAPASEMLGSILAAIPLLAGATVLMTIAYVVGRVVSTLIRNVLAGAGFDNVLVTLGLAKARSQGRTPSELAGTLILVTVLLFASLQAAELLGFGAVGELIASFLTVGGHVVLGLIVLGVGLFLANLAAGTVRASGTQHAELLALATRVSIVVLAGAMALRQMGLANEIITLAFGSLIGAIAVAVALAFGLGARDAAGRTVDGWLKAWQNDSTRS